MLNLVEILYINSIAAAQRRRVYRMNFFVILPDQLFSREKDIKFILEYDEVYLVEDPVMFSLRSDSLKKVMHDAFRTYYAMLKNYISAMQSNETTSTFKRIKYVSRLKVMERGGSYVSKKDGGGGEKQFDRCNADEYHSYETTPCFLEYFVGMGKQFNMWRPANHWLWGNRIREMTFNGLPINFHESPQFLLPFDEVRKYFVRGESYSERTIIKNLFERFDLKYTSAPNAPNEYPIVYKLDGSQFPVNYESAQLVLDKFMSKYVSVYSQGYTCPQIDYILNIGLITPLEIIDVIRGASFNQNADLEKGQSKNDANAVDPEFIYFILRREYFRIIYLANSDLMNVEKFPHGLKNNKDNKIVSVDVTSLKAIESSGLCSEKQLAEYMMRSSIDEVGSWESCVRLMEVSANIFPWNSLPRSLGASIDLNAIRGKLKHYRSVLVLPPKECTEWWRLNGKKTYLQQKESKKSKEVVK